jgi:subfamily B ATP-binding cassette protein MsbA
VDLPLESQKGELIKNNADLTVEFENVAYKVSNRNNPILENISLTINPKDRILIEGKSGSGKSSLLQLISGLISPTSGYIYVNNLSISSLLLNEYRSNLGLSIAEETPFEGTIRENILFPRPNASEKQVLEAVKAAYVNEFTDQFDDGLDTLIGERGVKLSGGQRQRIAIARAVLANPRILILDEATSNLDTESESLIQKSLAELMKGRTTFVIAHRLSTIRQANQILVIEHGEIAEQGNHDALIKSKGRYFDLFTYQSRI